MTACAASPVVAELTTDERRAALRNLADYAGDMLPEDVAAELAILAHGSLTEDRRTEAFGEFSAALALEGELQDGITGWEAFEPELTCDDRQGRAAELCGDRVREFLYLLVNGEAAS